MERIIDGCLFESQVVPDQWDVRTFEVNGHREVSIRNSVVWTEVGTASPYQRSGDGYLGAPTAANVAAWAKQDADDAEERRLHNLNKSASRAATMVRRVIKAEGFNELLTLTYRTNQADRELCKKHFTIWFKRMQRALGGFRFCASFEMQKRGAMHVHIACHKLAKHGTVRGVKIKAFELGTRIWRDVIGLYPFQGPLLPGMAFPEVTNGLCFVGGAPKPGKIKRRMNMSIGKMASYVSKYIMKDYCDSPEEKNRYSRSNGTVVPKSVLKTYFQMALQDLISEVFACSDSELVIGHRIGHLRDSYWLVTEAVQT